MLSGSLILLPVLPSVVAAADEFAVQAGRMNLDYIWTLIAGALVFYIKSRKTI